MDPDNILLHANFQILKDFIEIELASWSDSDDTTSNKTILSKFRSRFRFNRRHNLRNPEAGIAHLEWEIAETTGIQREAAIEKKELYDWWVNIRPYREDPFSYKLIWKDNTPSFNNSFTTGDRLSLDLSNNLSNFYDQEDTEMLHRLINIRKSLWT